MDAWGGDYRAKNAVENSFDDLKNHLDMRRLRIHTSDAMDSRLFLQFLIDAATRIKWSFLPSHSASALLSPGCFAPQNAGMFCSPPKSAWNTTSISASVKTVWTSHRSNR